MAMIVVAMWLVIANVGQAAWSCTPDYLKDNPFEDCVETSPAGVVGSDVESQSDEEFSQVNRLNVPVVAKSDWQASDDIKITSADRRAFLLKLESIFALIF